MLWNTRIVICCLLCTLVFSGFTYADQSDQPQLPEKLEEITLDNVSRLVPLVTFSTASVMDLAWSSDGQFLAVETRVGVWIYHFEGQEIQSNLIQNDNSSYGVSFIGNSSQFIANKTIYDAVSLTALKPRPENLEYINHAGTVYVSATRDVITLYNLKTDEFIRKIHINSRPECQHDSCFVSDIAFSPDDSHLTYSGGWTFSESGIVEVSTGIKRQVAFGKGIGLVYSPDSSLIAYSLSKPDWADGRDGVQLADSKIGRKLGFVSIGGIPLNEPIFSRDGKLLMISETVFDTTALHGTLYFFSVKQILQKAKTTTEDAVYAKHLPSEIVSAAFSPDYHLLATGDENMSRLDGQLIIWGVPTQ